MASYMTTSFAAEGRILRETDAVPGAIARLSTLESCNYETFHCMKEECFCNGGTLPKQGYNHYVIILSTKKFRIGTRCAVAIITSVRGMSLREYMDDYEYFKVDLIPIKQDDYLEYHECKEYQLRLAKNANMRKQSFVVISHIWDVPISCLKVATFSWSKLKKLQLQRGSFDYLLSRFDIELESESPPLENAQKAQSPTNQKPKGNKNGNYSPEIPEQQRYFDYGYNNYDYYGPRVSSYQGGYIGYPNYNYYGNYYGYANSSAWASSPAIMPPSPPYYGHGDWGNLEKREEEMARLLGLPQTYLEERRRDRNRRIFGMV
ncbi:hypothetical protein B7463_g5941, partial [Scytalidium lignicola]